MSQYYSQKRSHQLFDPRSSGPFKLSRSKIDLFLECPRCFYLDRRLGVCRPPGFPFTLNSAVDKLLKREFDTHRAKQTTHPLMIAYGINAVPFSHEMMDEWRENFKGIRYHYKPTNLTITGAIDDLWASPQGELSVVDYKSTSKEGQVGIDAPWQISYKRQMEVYQWLFRKNGFDVSDTGYFVYCNARKDREAFNQKLEFDITIIPYKGSEGWVEETVINAHRCLMDRAIPEASRDCDYCLYIEKAREVKGGLLSEPDLFSPR